MRQTRLFLGLILPLSLTAASSFAATFCPWKAPAEVKPERFINLTVVQYVDLSDEEIRISFGGGNLGGGYEVKVATKNREDGMKILKSMQEASKQCDK